MLQGRLVLQISVVHAEVVVQTSKDIEIGIIILHGGSYRVISSPPHDDTRAKFPEH